MDILETISDRAQSIKLSKARAAVEREEVAAMLPQDMADRLAVFTLIDTYGADLVAKWVRDYTGRGF